jgi:hypothetical protein
MFLGWFFTRYSFFFYGPPYTYSARLLNFGKSQNIFRWGKIAVGATTRKYAESDSASAIGVQREYG